MAISFFISSSMIRFTKIRKRLENAKRFSLEFYPFITDFFSSEKASVFQVELNCGIREVCFPPAPSIIDVCKLFFLLLFAGGTFRPKNALFPVSSPFSLSASCPTPI
ncbi:hypothetical protein, partial [Bacteroides sp.]|uniref:hypothetical protein n=1 Tax=Bacteroides sp. TaxID=29523 RepID=UPI0023BEFCCF